MTSDPVEKARLAWLSARYRFEKLLRGEPSEEEYRKAYADLEQAQQRYKQMAATAPRRGMGQS